MLRSQLDWFQICLTLSFCCFLFRTCSLFRDSFVECRYLRYCNETYKSHSPKKLHIHTKFHVHSPGFSGSWDSLLELIVSEVKVCCFTILVLLHPSMNTTQTPSMSNGGDSPWGKAYFHNWVLTGQGHQTPRCLTQAAAAIPHAVVFGAGHLRCPVSTRVGEGGCGKGKAKLRVSGMDRR